MEENILILTATAIKKALNLEKDIHIQVSDLVNLEGHVMGKRIVLDFPTAEFWKYINKWQSWKNAYIHRKR